MSDRFTHNFSLVEPLRFCGFPFTEPSAEVDGLVDLDIFNGTPAQFEKLVNP